MTWNLISGFLQPSKSPPMMNKEERIKEIEIAFLEKYVLKYFSSSLSNVGLNCNKKKHNSNKKKLRNVAQVLQ